MTESTESAAQIAGFLRRLQWALLTFAVLWLVWLLGPVLTPFVLAALLGWLGDPLVDRLEARGHSRPLAVTLVFLAMLLVLVAVLLVLVPMIVAQIKELVASWPSYRAWMVEWFQTHARPWIDRLLGLAGMEEYTF